MKAITLAAALILVPTLVASGTMEIDLAQSVKAFQDADTATTMARLYPAICSNAVLVNGGQVVASTQTACVVSFHSTVVTFLFRARDSSVECTAVWYTADGQGVGDSMRRLIEQLGQP